jgi:hypothetical protein
MERGTTGQKRALVRDSGKAVGEAGRLARLAAGDPNAVFETNEIDSEDLAAGGDGIVYAASAAEAAAVRKQVGIPEYPAPNAR